MTGTTEENVAADSQRESGTDPQAETSGQDDSTRFEPADSAPADTNTGDKPWPKYIPEDGGEDRHGEMTGAISVNMVICAIPVMMWMIFIGPATPLPFWLMVTLGLTMAVVMPIALLPLSRRLWAWLSDLAERV